MPGKWPRRERTRMWSRLGLVRRLDLRLIPGHRPTLQSCTFFGAGKLPRLRVAIFESRNWNCKKILAKRHKNCARHLEGRNGDLVMHWRLALSLLEIQSSRRNWTWRNKWWTILHDCALPPTSLLHVSFRLECLQCEEGWRSCRPCGSVQMPSEELRPSDQNFVKIRQLTADTSYRVKVSNSLPVLARLLCTNVIFGHF